MRRALVTLVTLSLLLLAAAQPATAANPNTGKDVPVRHVGTNYNHGQELPIGAGEKIAGQPPLGSAKVGSVRTWLGLDDFNSRIYLKNYTLRGVGSNVEVWVANNLNFPTGDCRNDGIRNVITDTQVNYLIGQFDGTIYPIESDAFSVPPDRDGKKAVLPSLIPNLPSSEYKGEGDNIVVLVDNVRDDNYYDTNNANTHSYIAGFFYSVFNEYFNRNVMTIDSWDWVHRTGATPPNEPSAEPCTSAPARPFLYEGVFAHEYQHLLEYYEDPDEVTWVNEGLSDFAIGLTGYGDPATPITESGFDSHVQCFLGYLGVTTPANPIPRDGGPENSLTLWSDQGDDEILCDYGAAYTFMELVHGRYGLDFMSVLHRSDTNGLPGLQGALDQFGTGDQAQDVLHDWTAMVALDAVLDDGASLTGGSATDFQTGSLDASIRWDATDAYNSAGAPPNGSDYVRLRDGGGAYLGAGAIDSISFNGADSLPALPIEWTVDPDGHATGDAAFFSGKGDNFDRAIAMQIAVPVGTPALTFDTTFDTEPLWDFGFVQVSTDGGATYTSLANASTTTDHDPGADPKIVANLPGFTGDSGGWRAESFDLSAYAGQNVILAFRYMTDASVQGDGFWVDNISVGGSPISNGSDLTGWQSPTAIHPISVSGFTVQLIAYTDDHTAAWIGELSLDGSFEGTLDGASLDAVIGTSAETVAAIVTYDEPSESVSQYAPYVLTVNEVTQPGG